MSTKQDRLIVLVLLPAIGCILTACELPTRVPGQGNDGGGTASSVLQFQSVSHLSSARSNHASVTLQDGSILVIGGFGSPAGIVTSEIFNPISLEFSSASNLNASRTDFTATLLQNGQVLVTGGDNYGVTLAQKQSSPYMYGLGLSSAELFDPSTGTFSYTGSMAMARAGQTATLLSDGKVLVTGGCVWNISTISQDVFRTVEIYNPANGTFSSTAGSMSAARCGHTATILQNGKVLIVGGTGSSGELRSTEIYDPFTQTFSAGPSLYYARDHHSALLLPNGRVLVTGGWQCTTTCNPIPEAEVIDVSLGESLVVGSMSAPRVGHSSVLLPNGLALIIGGQTTSNGVPTATTELFNPSNGGFTPGPALNVARTYFSLSTLDNGDSLITGGRNGNTSYLDDTEILKLPTETL